MSNIAKQSIAARRDQFIRSWRQYAPEITIADMTLAQFEASAQSPDEVRSRQADAQTVLSGIIIERKVADHDLNTRLIMLANMVRGMPAFGYNSPFYRSLGFVTKNERKVRTLKPTPTPVVTPTLAPMATSVPVATIAVIPLAENVA
jgi:hypothetical protein